MKPAHIVCILDSNGFPNGMAATQRIKLLAKALLLQGVRVTILCIRALERPPVENVDARGYYHGIGFEYTPGTTIRAERFLKRRWLEVWGLLVSLMRLLQFRSAGELQCIYLWGTMGKLTFTGCFYRAFAGILGVPLLAELNERPWSLKDNPSYLEKWISPLVGISGVVVISSFLQDWVRREMGRTSKKVAIQYIPILVDFQEAADSNPLAYLPEPVLVFAGAPQYGETIRFLFEVMKSVREKYPLCQLYITGVKDTDPAGIWLRSAQTNKELQQNIRLIGFVSRSELLSLYRKSTALLIPLFDDIRSRARFPTKLGEYLGAGRPVITNKIGESTKYLVDGQNAFLCDAGDPIAYAKAICKVLEDPDRADEIGRRGREAAQRDFDYVVWGEPLSRFISGLR